MLRRNLHARHVKRMASVMSPECLHLSPLNGLLLLGSPALGSLWAAGESSGPPTARLARVLFNRHDSQEPLSRSRNKSHPAAHLTPELQGACLGCALQPQYKQDEVRRALLELGVANLARETRVSIARFERFTQLLSEAVAHPEPLFFAADIGSATVSHSMPASALPSFEESAVQCCGISVMLAHVWASAESKLCLLKFLTSLQRHAPHLTILHPSAAPECESWRDAFVSDNFGDEVQYNLGGGSRSIAPSSGEFDALVNGGESSESARTAEPPEEEAVPREALERLAYTLAAREGCAPEVRQEVHGYRGQPAVADCVEACAREALGLALWDAHARGFDTKRLPPSADPAVAAFFHTRSEGQDAGKVWFDLVSARPGLDYMLGLGCGGDAEGEVLGSNEGASRRAEACVHAYELFPSLDNFAKTLASLLGVSVVPPEANAPPAPIWPACRTVWQHLGCDRHPVVMVRSDDGTEMRIVFNGQRHCYSLRDATQTEPAWIGRVRSAWRMRLRTLPEQARAENSISVAAPSSLHAALHASAARLLALRGKVEMARHEQLHLEARRREERSFGDADGT